MNLRRLIFTSALLIFGVTGTFAQGGATAKQETPMRPDTLEFPAVEAWRMGEKGSIPGEESGVAVNYDSADRERTTVYVYSRGQQAPNDLTGIIKDEFEGAKEALQTIADMGLYKNLKVSKSDTAMVGGTNGKVKALRALISFEAGGTKLNSEIYVFPYKGHVAKLRISRPATLPADGAAYLAMMAALDAFFSK